MAFDIKRVLFGIVEGAKKGYYFFEDRYYSLLDIVNEKIPVYRIIDPVDNVVPSFVLFIAAVIALFVAVFFFSQPSNFAAIIRIVDSDGLPIASQEVNVTLDAVTVSFLTDENGVFQLALNQKEQAATILIEAEGFEKFEKELVLVAGENIVSLVKAGPIMFSGPFNIAVVDFSGLRITDTEVTVRFSCSLSLEAAPEPITNSDGFFTVSLQKPRECGDLFASFVAAGYEQKNNVRISRESEQVELAKLDSRDSKGKINIIVKDASNNAVAGALVALFDSEGIKLLEDSSDASGMLVFVEIAPATYELSASTEDGRQAKKTVLVEAGLESTITITLPNATEAKKIVLKLVDANTGEPLNGVSASIFDNNSFFKSAKSDVHGIITVNVASVDETKSFSAVLTHPSFVLKIAKDLVVSSGLIKDAQVVQLEKIAVDGSNYGSLKVFVVNEQNALAVPSALVSLFFEGFENPLFENPKIADDNGMVFFTNLPTGYFKAYAQKQSFDGDFSPAVELSAGSTVTVFAKLFLGRGAFDAHVTDLQGKPIQDATVEFFELITNALLDSGKTNAAGNYLSKSFKANRNVYLHVTATGFLPQTIFLPQTTNPFSVIKDINRDVNVMLYRVIEIDQNKKISFKFVGLFKEDKLPVAILQPNQVYLAKFNLVLPSDSNYSNVVMHVRAGLDSQTSVDTSNVVLRNVSAPLLPNIVLSRDFNPANPFSNQNTVQSDLNAKQVNVSWKMLEKGVFEIIAKLYIKPDLAMDTAIELHSKAKASIDGTEFASDDFVERFKVGQTVCTQNCPAFDWVFEIQKDAESFALEPSKKFALNIESDYNLFYKIYNLGETSFSSSSLIASLANNGILSFRDANLQTSLQVFSNAAIPAHSAIVLGMQSPIQFHSNIEAAFVDINLSLSTTPAISSSDKSNNAQLLFKVLAGNELLVELPQAMPRNAYDLTIKVRDKKTGELLNNAFVWVLPDGDLAVSSTGAVLAAKVQGNDGEYLVSFEQGFAPTDFVSVKVSAPNYKTFFGKLMVTGELNGYPSNFDYSCLTIDANPSTLEFEGTMVIERPKTGPRKISVLVSANKCEYDSVVSISAPFYLADSIQSEAEKSLGKTESKTFTITIQSNVPQGKIPLYLSAKFSEDSFRRRLKGSYLIVTDPLSCFAMIAPQASLGEASTIVETSQSDFEAGTLDKIDAVSVPGELRILLEEGSRITSLGNGWFAVPATNKVYVFQYNNQNLKAFNAPGVKPESGIAGAAGYFAVVADDIVFASKYSDAVDIPKVSHNAMGAKTSSQVVALVSGTGTATTVYFATVVDGNRAYVWQPDSNKFDILVLGGVDSKSAIAGSGTYFSVVGDNNSFSWDFRHITNETAFPIHVYFTPGTKQTSRLAVSTSYFATVANDKVFVWNAVSGSFVAANAPGVSAASKIIPSETTTSGFFFVSGTDNSYSVLASNGSTTVFPAPGIRPDSSIASAGYYFVSVGTGKAYSGYKNYLSGNNSNYLPKAYSTPGTIPNSTVKVNNVSGTRDYFSIIADGNIFSARFGYPAAEMKQFAAPAVSQFSSIETPLIAGDAYFFAVGTDHSFLWKGNSPPVDLSTFGTTYFSSIGFDSATKNFVVSGKDKLFFINEMVYADKTNYPVKSIEALQGVSFYSKIASYQGNFIVTGKGKMYSINYDFSTKALSKTEYSNASDIDIPSYAALATYTTKNYFSFGASPSATIISISWLDTVPLQTSVFAQYSLDNGLNWNVAGNGDYIYRTAEQLKLRFSLSTSNELITPSVQEITIKYTQKTDALMQNKFVFDINHSMDIAAVQNKCYGFVADPQLPALNVIAGIEPSAIILRYEPLPKPPATKLTELYKFPSPCTESATGNVVECPVSSDSAEDTFVSEVNIPDCNQHSSAANYKLKNFGYSPFLLDARQGIFLTQDVNGFEQDCFDYVLRNYILFKFKPSFLYSLPKEQKKVRLILYSSNESIFSHQVFRPNSGWSELTVWETMPSIGNKVGELSYVGNHWWELDITDIYRAWKDNPETNNGLYIISDDNLPLLYNDNFPGASFGAFSFCSSNNSDASKIPRIVFGYETASDTDTRGVLDFNVSNNSLVGEENYALLDYNDYAWSPIGKLVTSSEKFHVQLKASQQQNCAMPNNVFGKTGKGALPNILFSWQWKNNKLNDSGFGNCDQNTQNYVYCDSTQFSIELLRKINEIRQLALQPGKREEITKYLHFNAYLMKDGCGTDFRKDFDYYMRNITSYNTEEFYKDTMFGLYKYFDDESRWEFVSSEFNNPVDKVLKKPGLYRIDLGFFFEGDQFVFFSGNNPSAKITVTMTFLKDPATPNPLYELPFDGEIGFSKRPDEAAASRQNYGLAYAGEQDVYIVNAPGEEIVKTNNVSSLNPANTLAVSKDASIQALNASDLRGGLLLIRLSDKSLKFMQTSATPLVMEIDSIDANARGFYKIEQLTNPVTNETQPITFSDYGNVWTGIFSTMSCRDFSGKNLFYNVPDRNAFSLGEGCTDRNYSRGFKWVNAPTSKTLILRTIFFSLEKEVYLLRPACSGQTKFVSPNSTAYSNQTGSAIELNFSKQKWPSSIDSIASIFDLVKEGKACVSSPKPEELFFWWNPQFLERELLPEANNRFSVLSLLATGTALCPEQGTESQP